MGCSKILGRYIGINIKFSAVASPKTAFTNKNDKHVNERMDDYIQIRMSKEWKNKVKMISELNNCSFGHFVRQSVDKNIQSLS